MVQPLHHTLSDLPAGNQDSENADGPHPAIEATAKDSTDIGRPAK